MTDVRAPYYVSFVSEKVPTTIDHSQSSPGPSTGSADRAGRTKITAKPRVEIFWDNLPVGADGKLPLFVRSANIFFFLRDFVVAISSDYAVGSCAYNATLEHEIQAHIISARRVFFTFRYILVQKLNAIPLPTETAPLLVPIKGAANPPKLIDQEQERLAAPIRAAIAEVKANLAGALTANSKRQDEAGRYRVVYQTCTPAQWASAPDPAPRGENWRDHRP